MTGYASRRHFRPGGHVPLAGLEADPVAHRHASRPCLDVPHDLMSRIPIMLAGAAAAKMGD